MNRFYELAKAKGFHENDERDECGRPTPRQMLAWAALLISEVLEMHLEGCEYYLREDGKPEGWLAEAADVVIRANDTIGACGHELTYVLHFGVKPAQLLLNIIEAARDQNIDRYVECLGAYVTHTRSDVEASTSGSLDAAIEAKHAYNQTRPYKHGRKA